MPLSQKKIQCNSNSPKPWITSGLIKSIHRKNTLYRNHLCNRDPALDEKYKKYIYKQINISYSHGRKINFSFNKFISAKHDINKTWHIIKAINNPESNKKQTLNEIIINNAHVTDKEVISTNFNEYFVNIGPILAKKNP